MGTNRTLCEVITPLLDWIAPPRCVACDRLIPQARAFCEDCAVAVEPVRGPHCPRCGEPGGSTTCAVCRRQPPPFVTARAAYLWGGAVAQAVRRFKYGGRLELAGPLGGLFAPLLASGAPDAELLATVPMSAKALRQRGFHQGVELVAGARRTGIELPPSGHGLLRRVGDRPPQASLPPAARRALPRSTFRVPDPSRVRDRAVLLVDDVMTTGATVRCVAAALLEAGARRVTVATLARVER
jgi:predicted amidophosphoribosyltransferase